MREKVDMRALLEAAKCPCCDGSGGRYDNYGNAEQCQWCHERSVAIATPTAPDEERLAMEAVMESVDPATWPGLTLAQRCALGRFEKPQPAEPVAWVAADTLNSPHPTCISSLAYMSQLDRERGREYVPLYASPPAQPDAALVEALEDLLSNLDESLEDLELFGLHRDQSYRKLKDWYRKMLAATKAVDAALAGKGATK